MHLLVYMQRFFVVISKTRVEWRLGRREGPRNFHL